MPIEMLADFRPSVGATKADDMWTAVAISYALRMAAEPGARFRIRGMPQGVASQKSKDGATMYEQPITLDSDDVPAVLRERLEVPKAGEFWVRTYTCETCLDPQTGRPGRWVPHQRMKLHKSQFPDHEIKKGPITMKGLRSTWTPDRQVFVGSPERLAEQVPLMPAAALTWAPRDTSVLARLKRFSWIAILPALKSVSAEDAAAALRKVLPSAESVEVLPRPPADKDAFVAWLIREVDQQLLAPGAEAGAETADDAELMEQIKRDEAASIALGRMRTAVESGRPAAQVKEAVKAP